MTIEELRNSVELSFQNDNNFAPDELLQIVQYALGTSSKSIFATGIDAAEIQAAKDLLQLSRNGLAQVQQQRAQLLAVRGQYEQQWNAAQQGVATMPMQGQIFGAYNPAVEMSRNAAVARQAKTEIEKIDKTLQEADTAMVDWNNRVQAYTVIEQSFRNNQKWTEKLLHPFT